MLAESFSHTSWISFSRSLDCPCLRKWVDLTGSNTSTTHELTTKWITVSATSRPATCCVIQPESMAIISNLIRQQRSGGNAAAKVACPKKSDALSAGRYGERHIGIRCIYDCLLLHRYWILNPRAGDMCLFLGLFMFELRRCPKPGIFLGNLFIFISFLLLQRFGTRAGFTGGRYRDPHKFLCSKII